ncbi:hypothetical protein FG379_001786 [Cryptosporidium bovis]|uniref:uncharacterized protein n=1 Tax=Cryptosporidium bovis TaxID=310047 RepID=UPI00351A1030|nr:hypothetical protein FG379_001786 [Cryptosporidium bovis]
MVYESGQVMDNILPSQSQGLERSDSYSLNRRGGGFGGNASGGIGKLGYDRYNQIDEKMLHEVENTDWRKGRDNLCDLSSNNYGKSNYSRNNRESRYKDDIEGILENTNWRSDIKRTNSNNTSSDKYSHDYDKDIDLDFRRGSISRTNSKNNNPDLSPSSNYNWRDSSNSNQESSFGIGRYNRENNYSSSKPIIDDRPDYLKNRFKKVVDNSNQDSVGSNNSLHCSNANKDQTQQKTMVSDQFLISIDRHENLTKKLAQVQSQTVKIEKKNKNNNLTVANVSLSKKNNAQKDNKKYEEPETDLSYWNVKTEDSVYAFEKDLWTCIIGEEPIEKMTPKNSFSPGTFSPPKESCVISFINNIESAFDVSDLNTLTLVAKLSHVVTIMSSSLRCLPDIISLIQSLLPLFNNLIERNIAGKNLTELYILIETQRMAFTIGNPKIDTVTSLIEGLWLALLKTKVIRRETFNSWLSKTDSLADESKVGRKNALFEVSLPPHH